MSRRSDATSLAPCPEHEAEWIHGTRFVYEQMKVEPVRHRRSLVGYSPPNPSASIPPGKGADAGR